MRTALLTLSLTSIVAGCLGHDVDENNAPDDVVTGSSALAAPGLTWSHVEIGGGRKPSLAFDGSGVPALAYERSAPTEDIFNGGDITLVYAENDGQWRTGAGWTHSDVGFTEGLVEGDVALAFDGETPQLAYTRRTRTDQASGFILRLAKQSATGWDQATIDANAWVYQTAQVVRGGATSIGYGSTSQPGVQLARSSSTGFDLATNPQLTHDLLMSIDMHGPQSANVIGFAASRLGRTGQLAFSQTSDGTTWTTPVKIETQSALRPRIAYYSTQRIAISYTQFVGSGGVAKLATSSDGGRTWTRETVASYSDRVPATAITFDGAGNPLVALTETGGGASRMHLARKTGGAWSLTQADSQLAPWLFGFPEVALSTDGRVVLTSHVSRSIGAGEQSKIRVTWSSAL
jgi:hypothetical protein